MHFLFPILLLLSFAETWADLEIFPKEVEAWIDAGQIKSGNLNGDNARDQTISRTGVKLSVSGVYDKKLTLRFGIDELLWYPLPIGELSDAEERAVKFESEVEADGILAFGNPEYPFARLQFGLFPYKYNPEAVNLGEYLYRCGAYPEYLWTGGWSYLDAASYMGQGVHFNLPTFGDRIIHDFTLFMERDIEPTQDLSPGYQVTWRPSRYLEFGSGAVWAHALSLHPEKLSPEDTVDNAYSKITGLPMRLARDSATLNTPANQLGYYTFRGIKVMARASIDIGVLLQPDRFRPGDFKLYSEIALLGVENQPFYYDRRAERMPVMAGINLPTLGLLNKLNLEMEYHKSRYENTIFYPYYNQLPIPLSSPGDDPYNYSDSAVAASRGKFSKDDWHWSVYASKKIFDGVTLIGQAASDHLRHFDEEERPHESPTTLSWKDWYYVLRLDFGLF